MPNVPSHVSEESPQKRNDMMPEVPWALVCPNLAKDDFNDFSTHHHYFQSSGTRSACSKFHENPHPSVKRLLMPEKALELLRS